MMQAFKDIVNGALAVGLMAAVFGFFGLVWWFATNFPNAAIVAGVVVFCWFCGAWNRVRVGGQIWR